MIKVTRNIVQLKLLTGMQTGKVNNFKAVQCTLIRSTLRTVRKEGRSPATAVGEAATAAVAPAAAADAPGSEAACSREEMLQEMQEIRKELEDAEKAAAAMLDSGDEAEWD